MIKVLFFTIFFKFLSANGVLEVSRMDCHIGYEIPKGYKPITIEIQGLKKNTDVIITDREIDREKCGKNPIDSNDICVKTMRFCKGFLSLK